MTAAMFALLAAMVIPGRTDVTKSVIQIHSDAFEKHLKFEQCLLVRKMSVDFVSGSGDNVQFKMTLDIQAVIHTHPDKGFEKPSDIDVQTAIRYSIPVYVVSESAIYYVTTQGEIRRLE